MENNNNNNNSDRLSDSDDVMRFDVNDPYQELFIVSDADELDDEAFYAKYRQRLRELRQGSPKKTTKKQRNKTTFLIFSLLLVLSPKKPTSCADQQKKLI